MPLLISITGFIVLMLIFLLWYNDYFADRITVSERLKKYVPTSYDKQEILRSSFLVNPPSEAFWLKTVKKLGAHFQTSTWAQQIEHKLVQADLPFRGSEFIIITGIVMLAAMVFSLLLSDGNILIGIIGLVAGYLLPLVYVNLKISKRLKAFNGQLPDALVLIASSLRSGYSFMQAMEMVGTEMQPPISVEFYRVLREINLGVTTSDALNHMAGRINSEDLDLMVTAVLIQRQIGGNMAEILDSLAHTIRERVKIKGHISTLTAQGRLSGVIVCLLPIVLGFFISLTNPGFLKPLFTQPLGHAMLLGAAINEAIGIILISKIVNIEV